MWPPSFEFCTPQAQAQCKSPGHGPRFDHTQPDLHVLFCCSVRTGSMADVRVATCLFDSTTTRSGGPNRLHGSCSHAGCPRKEHITSQMVLQAGRIFRAGMFGFKTDELRAEPVQLLRQIGEGGQAKVRISWLTALNGKAQAGCSHSLCVSSLGSSTCRSSSSLFS